MYLSLPKDGIRLLCIVLFFSTAPVFLAAQGGSGELDMREANVVDVAFQETGSVDEGRVYRFDVTLVHDDEGEDGYANWWQVEDLGGTQLGRRTLLHAHTNAPFTRSEQITVPTGVGTVVVRGHDQTHGYGGQVILVDMATGEEESVRQGSEPHSFAEE